MPYQRDAGMNARRIIIVGLVLLLSSSCGQAPRHIPTVVPTDRPIPVRSLFKGRLIVGHSDGVYLLASDPATGEIQKREIYASGENELTVSPDGRYLLFSNEPEGTGLIDLSTWEVTSLFPSHVHCLQWAADSRRISLVGGVIPILYVFQLNPETPEVISSERIYISPAELYTSEGRSYAGDLDCGYWVGENRLLFKSYRGPMPARLTFPGTPELHVNTTTLALLGEHLALSHFPWLLSVKDVSDDLSNMLVELHSTLYIGKPFEDFNDLRLRPLTKVSNLEIDPGQFTPDSQEIILWTGDTINFVNIETLQVSKSFSFPSEWKADGFVSLVEAEWVGDPHEGILIWNNPEGDLRIGDLNTGTQIALWITAASEVESLIWMP